jgi:hypothetical protein
MSCAFTLTLLSEGIGLLIRGPIDRYTVFAKESVSSVVELDTHSTLEAINH